MSDNKKYYWLKLKDGFFKDKEMKKLRKIAGGDTYTIIYLKLQLLSLKDEGKLVFTNLEDSFSEEMALELDEESENVKVTILYLQKCGLLEEVAENEYILLQTINSIGNETQGAERVRKFRDKGKALLCNTTVQNCNTEIRDKREEIEIEIDIDKKKTTTKKGFDLVIADYTDNVDLRNTIIEFIKMRKANKSTPTDFALKKLLIKLNTLANDDNKKISILEQSIMNGWKGIFAIKEEKYKGNPTIYGKNKNQFV
ncbi:phage replisome organizer N-terminal domain-containing protein, partial [Clostridium sp.]|uniref:phage replisome organizer N-terminal domain-containing protein n=1 Tax=Clostridium sp. TaxID=1506 RepID=UPI003EE9B8F7